MLTSHDREMRGFVVACLAKLTADPDRFLDELAEHWPARKPRGRPRKSPPEGGILHDRSPAPDAELDGKTPDLSTQRPVHLDQAGA